MSTDPVTRLTPHDVAPLVDHLARAHPPIDALTIRALAALPLSDGAWMTVAETLIDVIDARANPSLLAAAAAVPVTEVRQRVHEGLANSEGTDALTVATALAEVRDDSCVDRLTSSLPTASASEQLAIAQALSFVAPHDPAPVRLAMEQVGTDDARLWLALHLARGGDPDPIAAVVTEAVAGSFDAAIYHGDPRVASAAIEARAPLPEVVIDLASAHLDSGGMLIEHLVAAGRARPQPRPLPEPTPAEVAEATELANRLLSDPGEWAEWDTVIAQLEAIAAAVPDEIAARLVGHILAGDPPVAAGNLMVDLVATHSGFTPNMDALLDAYVRLAGSSAVASQVAWVASRAPLRDVVARAAALLDRHAEAALAFLADVGRSIDDPHGPILGGGPGPAFPAPVTDLISLRPPEPAYAAPPDDLGLESLGPADSPAASPGGDAQSGSEPESASDSDEVYALLEGPPTTQVGEEFELAVGLSPKASTGVVGGPLEGLGGRAKPYIISIQVVADGFDLRDGDRWRHDLAVTADQPFPSVMLHLTAVETDEPIRAATLSATYTVDGQMVGMAVRPIAVIAQDATPPTEQPADAVTGADLSIPTGPVPADLTVALHKTRDLHLLRMTIESPHASVPIPAADVEVDIGEDPSEYARNLVRAMDSLEGQPQLRRDLKGRGRQLAASLPQEFWEALRAAAQAAGGTPSLLLVSAEGRIPWELAVVDPPLDASAPEFLSTQTVMGRWVLGNAPLPPPHEHETDAMVVVTGDYEDLARWETLQAAFEERDHLQATYDAEPVEATYPDVTAVLSRDPAPSVLHLAVHGKYEPGPSHEGLVLTDKQWLTPNVVMAEKLAGRSFVFLNACQVGSGSDVLHQYSGMAAAFLAVGASGVIAPLWSVKDDIARDIATGFYAATMTEGLSVGEAIRRERVAFGDESVEAPTSATFMAYQYFGHPTLQLTASERGTT